MSAGDVGVTPSAGEGRYEVEPRFVMGDATYVSMYVVVDGGNAAFDI